MCIWTNWHSWIKCVPFSGIFIFGMYIAIKCFLSHCADGAINYTIAVLMLRWLFRRIIILFQPVLIPILATVSSTIDDIIDVMWCQSQWYHMIKKSHVVLHFYHLDVKNAVAPLMIPFASHDQKTNLAHHFDCLDLRTAVVSLTVLLASYDANANTSGITWSKKSY